jgi:hypothetical protein
MGSRLLLKKGDAPEGRPNSGDWPDIGDRPYGVKLKILNISKNLKLLILMGIFTPSFP